MAVLITGAGLVGAQVAAQLMERGETPILYDIAYDSRFLSVTVDTSQVKAIVGDILDLPFLLATIKSEKVERIIHTASLLDKGVRARPYSGVKVNIIGTLNVLEAAKLTEAKRVVFTSTQMVRSGVWDSTTEAHEDFTMKCISQMPQSIYSVTKLTAEYLGLSYHKFHNVDFVALRLGSLFGPWFGTPSGRPSRFADMFVKNAAFGRPVIIDDPANTYSGIQNFVYSKDVAKACVLACLAGELKSRIYNISGDKPYTFQEVVDATKRVFPESEISVKKISETGWDYTKPVMVPLDISAARNELGYQPDYDLEKAFRDYGDWLRRYAKP